MLTDVLLSWVKPGFYCVQVFVKGLLEKFKVQPEVFRREEYKVGARYNRSYSAAHLNA